MLVRFWGTRGSIAKAGPGTLRYGGNTSCVEICSATGTLVVLDCGTGSHGLGQIWWRQAGSLYTAISSSATRIETTSKACPSLPPCLCPVINGRSMDRMVSALPCGTHL
jgi:hypothetical protein